MTMPLEQLTCENTSWQLGQAFSRRMKSGNSHRLLLSMPLSWSNRYQPLLYGEAHQHDWTIFGINDMNILEHISWPGTIILHVHWLASLLKQAPHEGAARAAMKKNMEQVETFLSRTDARLIWTAHNVFPHSMRWPELWLEIRQWLFKTCFAIHVLDEKHIPLLEETYGVKAPLAFVAPHMLYTGAYPDCINRECARDKYDLPKNSFVFAEFGSIQRYKGIEKLLEAVDSLASTDKPVYALVAGIPSDPALAAALLDKWGSHPRVRLVFRNVPDHEIQYVFHAADAMVFPYEESLNSGAAFLAASFKKPFLMPAGPTAHSLEGLGVQTWVQTDGLPSAMLKVMAGHKGTDSLETRQKHMPQNVSNMFFEGLGTVLKSAF